MFYKIKNNNGFSLIELLIVLMITASIVAYAMQRQAEEIRKDAGKNLGKKMHEMIQTLDTRFFVDGYDEENFIDIDGNSLDKDIEHPLFQFIKEQMYTDNHPCVNDSNWINDPDAPANTYYGLSNCNMFPGDRLPFKIKDASVNFELTFFGGLDAIKRINIDFNISESQDFMLELTEAVENAKKIDVQNVTGMHEFYFYDKLNNQIISPSKCIDAINNGLECFIRAAIDTKASDGSEYAKVNGANKFRGDIAFAASPDGDVANGDLDSCFVWSYTPSLDEWSLLEVLEDENDPASALTTNIPCGIQYYEGEDESGNASQVVSLASRDISVNRSITIDQECAQTTFNNVPVDSFFDDPVLHNPYVDQANFKCGIFKTNDAMGNVMVVAIVDDFFAETINSNTINSINGKIRNLTVDGQIQYDDGVNNFNINPINGLSFNGIRADITSLSTNFSTNNGLAMEINSFNDPDDGVNKNNINIYGVTQFLGKRKVTTDKEINEFVDNKEFVSKEYVDQYNGVLVRFKNTLQLNDIIRRFDDDTMLITDNETQFQKCPIGFDERYEVSPAITYGEPITVIYGLEKKTTTTIPNTTEFRVAIDKDTLSSDQYPWPTGSTRPWANVSVYCIKN